ncbi:MAG: Crp/Fnr family transcriptional regulator [Maribacter sp.]|nr:Crp/Fnr family transcriptional regulator [Maribacter sp.]
MLLIEFLKKSGVTISDELQKDFLQAFSLKKYKKGDYFHEQGLVCKQLGFLVDGQVALQYVIDGNAYTRWAAIKGSFITSFGSFINEEPSIDGLLFLADSTVLVTTKTEFDRLSRSYPDMQGLVIKVLSQDLLKYQHLTNLLITTKGTERYLQFQAKYPKLSNEIPQKYIASILGMNPRHLSRIKRKLTSDTQ